MEQFYSEAAKKIQQMEADGVDMVEYQNQLRARVMGNLAQMGKNIGVGDGSIESVMRNYLSSEDKTKLDQGLKRQMEIINELLPWLTANNFSFTNPTTMGVFFITNNNNIRFSICKETSNIYDVEIYIDLQAKNAYIDKTMGYNKSRKFTAEGLKEELLKLRNFKPN